MQLQLDISLQKPRHDAVTALESKSQRLDKDQTGVICPISLFPGGSNFKKNSNKNKENQETEVAKVAVSVSPQQQLQNGFGVSDASGLPYLFLEMSATRLY